MEDKTIKEHLIELRNLFLKVLFLFIAIFIPVITYSSSIIGLCITYFGIHPYILSPAEYFHTQIWLSISISAIVTAPFFLWQMIKFIKPLFPKEDYKNALALYIYSLDLAIAGAFIGFFILGKYILSFLGSVPDDVSLGWSLASIFNLLWLFTWTLAIIFQIIIIIPLLNYYKIISRKSFCKYRWIVAIVIFIGCAFLPINSITSQIIIATPIYCLFELALIIAKIKGEKIDLNTYYNKESNGEK